MMKRDRQSIRRRLANVTVVVCLPAFYFVTQLRVNKDNTLSLKSQQALGCLEPSLGAADTLEHH
jgi:hypothetical protein